MHIVSGNIKKKFSIKFELWRVKYLKKTKISSMLGPQTNGFGDMT